MSGFSFNFNLLNLWLLYLHFELIFFFFYKKLWLISHTKQKRILTRYNNFHNLNPHPYHFFFLYIFFFFFFKQTCLDAASLPLFNIFFLYFFSLLIYLVNIYVYWYLLKNLKNLSKYIHFIFQFLFLFLGFLYYSTSLLTFLLVLELYSVIYYFFFLNSYANLSIKLVKQYKNLILFYLWNSFFTTLFFGIGSVFIVKSLGTLSFFELNFFSIAMIKYSYFIIFVAFFVKLGLPLFHFFKLEIYKYLDAISLFFFSSLTIYYNIFLLIFFVAQPITLNYLSTYNFFFFFIFFFFFVSIFFYNIYTMYNFLAVSSLITLVTVLVILFI